MDRGTFASEYQRIYHRLWLIAAAMTGDRSQADDLVQEAAVIALSKLDRFTAGTNFAAWMAEIVRRCSSNHTRKFQTRGTVPTDPTALDQHAGRQASMAVSSFRPDRVTETSVDHGDFDDPLLHGLNQLSPVARGCLLLRIVRQLTYDEIAQLMGIPQGTAMSHVHRSKHALREFLRQQQALK
ncbi:MAG TPA: RNA polymerase sigma factor [Pirellulaceae bacterium]